MPDRVISVPQATQIAQRIKNKFDNVNGRLGEQKEIVERLNEGGLDIKDEVIETQITDWLNNHPEATTTVQDGAISEAKLASALKPKIMNTYVTPEMYGAVGDDRTDDTSAVQAAFDSGEMVVLTQVYFITEPLTAPKSLCVFGNSTRKSDKYNLRFSENVKACIILNSQTESTHVNFSGVGLMGKNLSNQGAFVSIGDRRSVITLENCIVSSFDAVLVGGFSISRFSNCTFVRIAKAFIFAPATDGSFSFENHSALYSAISGQISLPLLAGVWESSMTGCYVSGQGFMYENVGLFVGGIPIDFKISNCYIDYWSALFIDANTHSMRTEPINFLNCTIDSVITLIQTDKASYEFAAQGIKFIGCLFVRFNSTFDSDVNVPIYDFMYKKSGNYNRASVQIIDCVYSNTCTNPELSNYKFINYDGYLCVLVNCIFDFVISDVLINTTMADIVTIKYYSTNKTNRFPILNYMEFSTNPKVSLLSSQSDSFQGHIYTYNGNVYMNVNGTAYKINS